MARVTSAILKLSAEASMIRAAESRHTAPRACITETQGELVSTDNFKMALVTLAIAVAVILAGLLLPAAAAEAAPRHRTSPGGP